MARGPQHLEAFAQALATGVTAVEAAKLAGYPQGSQFAASARKRVQVHARCREPTNLVTHRDSNKMAGRGDRKLKKFAEALAMGVTPLKASELAGYPRGKSKTTYAANARKRARNKRVLEMVAELQKPVKEKLAKKIEANFAWATEKLMNIASAKLDLWNIKASDQNPRHRGTGQVAPLECARENQLERRIEKSNALNGSLSNLKIEMRRCTAPRYEARCKGAFGGGSGKSHFFFAGLVIEEYLSEPGSIVVCIRGTQRTLATLLNVRFWG